MLRVGQVAERCEAQGDCKGSKTGLRLGLCEWPGWQGLGRGGEGVCRVAQVAGVVQAQWGWGSRRGSGSFTLMTFDLSLPASPLTFWRS